MKKVFQIIDRSGRSAKPYMFDGEHIKNTWDLEEEDDRTGQTLEEFLEQCEVGEFWDNGNDIRLHCIEIKPSVTLPHNGLTMEQVTEIWKFFQENTEIDFGNTTYLLHEGLVIVEYVDGVFKTQEMWDEQSGDEGEDLTLGDVPMNILKIIYEKHSKKS